VVVILFESSSHSCSSLLAGQVAHEPKPARAAGDRVDHHHCIRHNTESLEMLSEFGGSCVLRQTSNKELVGARNGPFHINVASSHLM
jgi:hypothetical protein